MKYYQGILKIFAEYSANDYTFMFLVIIFKVMVILSIRIEL